MKILTALAVVASIFTVQPEENYYASLMKIVDINNNIVTMVDYNGNEWEWEGAEDLEVNDYVSCVMNDMGTQKNYDDKIVSIRYERIDF